MEHGISARLWFDLQPCWAAAAGAGAGGVWACKRTLAYQKTWDFQVGCPLCAAAVRGCVVMADRWVQPHLAVRSWFDVNRWSGSIGQRAQVTPLWLASWLPAVHQ